MRLVVLANFTFQCTANLDLTDFTTWILAICDQNNKQSTIHDDHIHWRTFRIDSSWRTLKKPSLYAALYRANNFKLIFDKVKARYRKIYVGKSCRELNSLSQGSWISTIWGGIQMLRRFNRSVALHNCISNFCTGSPVSDPGLFRIRNLILCTSPVNWELRVFIYDLDFTFSGFGSDLD